MAVARIGPRNQITIPAEVVKRLGLKPGDFLEVGVAGGTVTLTARIPHCA